MDDVIDLSTELRTKHGSLNLLYPVMNASGVLSFPPVLRSSAPYLGAVVTKSIGLKPRNGYREPIVAYDPREEIVVNAVGLANPGYKEFAKEIQESGFYPLVIDGRKVPVIISIFGNTPHEFAIVASILHEHCDALELNFGCPNMFGDEKGGMSIGQDPELTSQYTSAVRKVTDKPLIVKLTPNVDDIGLIAQAAVNAGADAISAINTVYPGEVRDPKGRPILTREKGGISGPTIKERGMEAVRQIRAAVDVPIIGMGGIRTAQDIIDYMLAGADAVAIGTAFMGMTTQERGSYLTKLYQNLSSLILSLGYPSLRGMLDAERRAISR